MKKILLGSFTMIAAAAIVSATFLNTHSNPTGAPVGSTGSPGDGASCFQGGCHFGAPSAQANMITSNIPTCGYTPGQQYTITASITGNSQKGFQVSPQDANGNFLGTLTAGSNNHTQQSGHYVTHNSDIGGSSATWSFTWTAPASGTGDVTFYGAFANGRGTTKTSTLVVQECTVGIEDMEAINNLSIFPSPAGSSFNIHFFNKTAGQVTIAVFNLSGQKVAELANGNLSSGNQSLAFNTVETNLKSGVYFVQVSTNDFQKVVKFVVE